MPDGSDADAMGGGLLRFMAKPGGFETIVPNEPPCHEILTFL
jgi:hypothetical protein